MGSLTPRSSSRQTGFSLFEFSTFGKQRSDQDKQIEMEIDGKERDVCICLWDVSGGMEEVGSLYMCFDKVERGDGV